MADTLVATSRVGVAHTLALVAPVTRTVVAVVAVRAWNTIQDDYVNWWGLMQRLRLLLHRDHGYEIECIFLSDHGWQDQDDTEILHPSEMTRK